jgi:2,4-dienoyl-CoA reductase-like NADH-dependent reductase (Old Yellow Enzyme family)
MIFDVRGPGDRGGSLLFGVGWERKIAFICARESLKEPRLGPQLKKAFGGVYVANQGFTPESAEERLASSEADAIAFGQLLLANPDLPRRVALRAP